MATEKAAAVQAGSVHRPTVVKAVQAVLGAQAGLPAQPRAAAVAAALEARQALALAEQLVSRTHEGPEQK